MISYGGLHGRGVIFCFWFWEGYISRVDYTYGSELIGYEKTVFNSDKLFQFMHLK